jgi:hypothetical protein
VTAQIPDYARVFCDTWNANLRIGRAFDVIDLGAIRLAANLTQREMAENLGLASKSGRVSAAQMEARKDWLLSRLASYIAAAGGTAELIVRVNGQELSFTIVSDE